LAKGDICPFDGLPCDDVDSCDDVLELLFGAVGTEDGSHCSHPVLPSK
jgi:hypothetical protein